MTYLSEKALKQSARESDSFLYEHGLPLSTELALVWLIKDSNTLSSSNWQVWMARLSPGRRETCSTFRLILQPVHRMGYTHRAHLSPYQSKLSLNKIHETLFSKFFEYFILKKSFLSYNLLQPRRSIYQILWAEETAVGPHRTIR